MSLDLRDELENATSSLTAPGDLAIRARRAGQRRLVARRRWTAIGSVAAVVLVGLAVANMSSMRGSTTVTPGSSTAPSGSTSGVPVSSTAATTGTLTGLVRVYGGAINRQTGKLANNGSPVTDLTVKVLSGSRTVAEAKSDAAGKFRFSLAPGRYTLACVQERSVVVVAGETVTVDCDVRVP